MHFLQELVQDYLILAHPQADLPQIEHAEEITHGDKEEDSFSQYYSSDIPKDKEKKKAAVKLKGEKLVHSDMHVTDVGRILRTFKIKKNVEVTDNGKIII